MIREEVISQQVRVELATGRLAAAQAVLKAEGFSFDGEFGYPDLTPGSGELVRAVTHPAGLLYNSALRILLFRARTRHDTVNLKRGIVLAGRVLAGELQCQHIPIALETLLLRGQMYAALGDERNSLVDVAKALELGEPEGFISIFVEEGPPIAEALRILLKRNLTGTVQTDNVQRMPYIRDILAAFLRTVPSEEERDAQSPPITRAAKDVVAVDESLAPIEVLTSRELEVLQLIAAGDSNRAIAEKLVITVSAVKKHTGNIYGKLNVNSRTQAVALARQLGLLPTGD
jgi:LuxR family maltose regulon positive regulatory protein